MKILVTGSGGLIGSESVKYFCSRTDKENIVHGIDNNMRKYFFGEKGDVSRNVNHLINTYHNYKHHNIDISDADDMKNLFYGKGKFDLIIHCAAQPSHDWSSQEPMIDFKINANATLMLLELTKTYCKDAVFIFMSTNKVYGDNPNLILFSETEKRFEAIHNNYEYGINEEMSIDKCTHSFFGVSKTAADLLVQEYGRRYKLKTACFRGGCITGSSHSSHELHGFLNYLVKCALTGEQYVIYGYEGKQVRDNIHASDLVSAFDYFYKDPKIAEVYNIGGSRFSNCSILEAIDMIECITNKKINTSYSHLPRIGDHIWYISDVRKFKSHFPEWNYKYDLQMIVKEIVENIKL